MSELDRTKHIPKFGGEIWYVSKGSGADTNSGTGPDDAFETIDAAITAASSGDGITVMAGTYVEDVVLGTAGSKDHLEMWCEIGTVLDGTGTCLTVAGNYCRVTCREGALKVTPAAGQTGVLVTGQFCYLAEIRVTGVSIANIGFDIGSADGDQADGGGADLRRCRCSAPLVAAFKVQADKVKLEDCCTGGCAGDSSIGFWVTNTAEMIRIKDCGSQGHEAAGYQIDTGCTNVGILNCSSGSGDGRWIDVDSIGVWSNFTYDDEMFKTQTLTANNTTASDNIFKFTGAVEVEYIYGHVTTVFSADIDDVYLNAWDGANNVPITKSTTFDMDAAAVGGYIHKTADADTVLSLMASDQVRLYEDDSKFGVDRTFILNAKNDTTCYVRMTYTTTDAPASGAIHWHCRWKPLTDDGFLEPA